MNCSDSAIYIRCGTTWDNVSFFERDQTTKAPVIIDGKKARGRIYDDTTGSTVLALSSVDGTLVLPAGTGRVNPLVASTITPSLSPTNVRRDLKLYIELYDDSVSPEWVRSFVTRDIVALPDLTPP